jgi:hypothetical protein
VSIRVNCSPLLCWKSKFKLGDLIEEQRKHAILFAATLLSARKMIDWMEPDKPTMEKQIWVDKAIREALPMSTTRML